MNLDSTELNRRLSSLVQNSVNAGRFYTASRVGFWRFVGIGLVLFGTGAAVGIAFYGYSYINNNVGALGAFSSALAKALSEVQLRGNAQGTVQIEPHELSLADGQLISLDRNARLHLDPTAKIRADGEIAIQTPPSISVPQSNSPRSSTGPRMITNFTVFKSVPLDKGSVMTGWKFLTSAQEKPTYQYCYYSESSETPWLDVLVDIGHDEVPDAPKTTPKGLDIVTAFQKCVWFKSDRP